ncbi:MAG: glycerol-3-phosphate responsive antiterminator [Lachnospiraceae bacterium]|nr:glycerol-3-phosphate responsive antiterminator [Lachnospiraceae bacterium]
MRQKLYDAIAENPIIVAVKNEEELSACIDTEATVVFLLFGSVENLADNVLKIKETGKIVFVHLDLVQGLSNHVEAVPFIKKYTLADGIISTRSEVLKKAKELSFDTVYRIFAIDSKGLLNQPAHLKDYVDCVEIMPGLMPKIISRMNETLKIPVIAGGLISEKEDVVAALDAGAIAISSTNKDVWEM